MTWKFSFTLFYTFFPTRILLRVTPWGGEGKSSPSSRKCLNHGKCPSWQKEFLYPEIADNVVESEWLVQSSNQNVSDVVTSEFWYSKSHQLKVQGLLLVWVWRGERISQWIDRSLSWQLQSTTRRSCLKVWKRRAGGSVLKAKIITGAHV